MLYSGTEVRLEWGARFDPPEALSGGSPLWPFSDSPCVWRGPENVFQPDTVNLKKNVYALVEGFALFNPHTTIALDWFGHTTTWEATDPDWKKWKPNQPTSAHWYERRHLERLIGAYITDERDKGAKESRLVSEFLAEFDGLSASAKQSKVLNAAGLKRARLTDFVVGDRLDNARIATLLDAMKENTKPVNPKRLGLIGEAHLKERLLRLGVVEKSFTYASELGKNPNLPWVLECAFGWLGSKASEERKITTGANWSAAISNPFRSFGSTREGLESLLADARAKRNEPIVYVLHLACPRVEYTDRGKSALVIGE